MRAVVLLALVMCAAVARAESEVAAAAGSTEATAAAEAAATVAAVAETQTVTTAAASTETEAVAATTAAATAEASTEAAAETTAEASTEASAEATAESTAEASAGASAEKPSDKKKDDKAKAAKGKAFKPVMINRDSRRAMRSHHQNVRYTDGGRAAILSFPSAPVRPDNRVEAEVGSPLRRRFARWADAIANTKQQFFTPPYVDDVARQRYTSFVPSDAYFAPRRPTHFEPEYNDEHQFLSGEWAPSPAPFTVWGANPYPFFPYFAPQTGMSGLPVIPVQPPRQRYTEPEYNDEHAFAEWMEANDDADAPIAVARGAPFSGVDFDFDFAPLSAPFDMADALAYERAVYPDSPRARPSSWELYGLPEFPAMPSSVPSAVAAAGANAAPFSGLDDPTGVRARSDFAIGAPVAYPKGSGPLASLQKLDFALERLQNLNAQLKAAEAKIVSSRLQQKQATDKLQRLNRIRGNLQKLAAQIASLEAKVSADAAVQSEVAAVVAATAQADGKSVRLASWLGDRITFNN